MSHPSRPHLPTNIWNLPLCTFLQPPIIFCSLFPSPPLSTLINTLSRYPFLYETLTVTFVQNRGQDKFFKKCKVISLQARCYPEFGWRYSSTLPWPRHLKGVSGQQHAPAALYPREKPGAHFTGSWVGPRAGLDGRKISSPTRIRSRTVQPVISRYTDSATRSTR